MLQNRRIVRNCCGLSGPGTTIPFPVVPQFGPVGPTVSFPVSRNIFPTPSGGPIGAGIFPTPSGGPIATDPGFALAPNTVKESWYDSVDWGGIGTGILAAGSQIGVALIDAETRRRAQRDAEKAAERVVASRQAWASSQPRIQQGASSFDMKPLIFVGAGLAALILILKR